MPGMGFGVEAALRMASEERHATTARTHVATGPLRLIRNIECYTGHDFLGNVALLRQIYGDNLSPGLLESTKEAYPSGLKFINSAHQDYMSLL